MKGWLVTLTDGRRFAYDETDGIHSERDARTWTLAREPDVPIESIREETVLVVVPLSEN